MRKTCLAMMLAAGGMALAMLSACHHSEKENYSHDVVTSTADVMEEIETPLKIADITHIRRPDMKIHVKRGQALLIKTRGLTLTAGDSAVQHEADYSVTSLTRDELAPLPQGMVNMTASAEGYRLLPGGEHFLPYAELRMNYDPGRLPEGYTPDDIYTSFYDTTNHAWVRLERIEVDTVNHVVVSATTHFTDFINELLKAPEMPETQAFVPTAMSDLEAVSPMDGLTFIQPPSPNNNGTANISYPFNIPAGRGGMQPNLALTYSSTGGSGWLGVGWDIPVSAITLDTRWGVPRYDTTYETEIYLIDGEQLVAQGESGTLLPMPHRTNEQTLRATLGSNVQFFTRTGDAHDSIIRHGDSTVNYWWEVVDRNGTTHYYGHYPDTSRRTLPATLRDDQGNIARWVLTESRDLYGNTVRYYYDLAVTHVGDNPGRQIYLDSISYTGHNNLDGYYTVIFCRTPNTTTDITTVCNNGFKEVSDQLLCNIRLKAGDSIVSAWLFEMENGYPSNFKNRLTAITRIDSVEGGIKSFLSNYCPCLRNGEDYLAGIQGGDGVNPDSIPNPEQWVMPQGDTLPNGWIQPLRTIDTSTVPYAGFTYTFSYYNAPAVADLFGREYTDELDSWHLHGQLNPLISAFTPFNSATALGLSHSSSANIGGTVAVGWGGEIWNSKNSGGGNYSHGQTTFETAMTLVDLDGDGLSDKVFLGQRGMYFCRRTNTGDSTIAFESPVLIESASHFLTGNTVSNTFGVQLSLGVSGNAAWSKSTSYTSTYFADVNGDGLTDIVSNGQVLFNSLDSDRRPSFSLYEYGDDSPLETSVSSCGGIYFDGAVDDSVTCRRLWELDTIFKLQTENNSFVDSLAQHYTQIGMKTEARIHPGDTPDSLLVYRPEWDCSPLDNALPRTDAVRVWIAPETGTISLVSSVRLLTEETEGYLASRHSDGVKYTVQRTTQIDTTGLHFHAGSVNTILDTQTLCNGYQTEHLFTENLTVNKGDMLFFRLQSRDSRQFDRVVERQQIVYQGTTDTFDTKKDFVLSGDYGFQAPVPGSYSIEENFIHGSDKFNFRVSSNNPLSGFLNKDEILFLEVRPKNTNIHPWGEVECHPYVTFIPYYNSDTLRTTDTLRFYLTPQMDISCSDGPCRSSFYRRLFGPLYRCWGQFAYRVFDDDTSADTLFIDRLVLQDLLDNDNYTAIDSLVNAMDSNFDSTLFFNSPSLEDFQEETTFYNPLSNTSAWVGMYPDAEHWRWVAYGQLNSIGIDTVSNVIEMDVDTTGSFPWDDPATAEADSIAPMPVAMALDDPVPAIPDGSRAKAIAKTSTANNYSFALGYDRYEGTVSIGDNTIVTDYMDFNGDRYPDIVGPASIQYRSQWGGLGERVALPSYIDKETQTTTISGGLSFNASSPSVDRSISSNLQRAKFTLSGDGSNQVGGSVGRDTASTAWLDINGDGLPDRINADGTVNLNVGYTFLQEEDWALRRIRTGVSGSLSGSGAYTFPLGDALSTMQRSIMVGSGLSVSNNQTTATIIDINGDGLPDKLWKHYIENGNHKTKVSFNLGNGLWTRPVNLDFYKFDYSTAYNESCNLGVTVGFSLWGCKFTLGLRGTPQSNSVNRDRIQLADIDGDGLPDWVSSDSEDEITVRYNQSGRTNLLRQVTSFTGADFQIEYTLSKPDYNQPSRSWQMTKVTTFDTLNYYNGFTKTVTEYSYAGPHYDRYERTSYGYDTVITTQINPATDNAYRKIERNYYTNNPLRRGRLRRELTYVDSDTLYIEKRHNCTYTDYSSGNVVSSETECPEVSYLSKEATFTTYYEGGSTPLLVVGEQTEYDRYHNVIKYTDMGDTSDHVDGLVAHFHYFDNLPHNLVGLRKDYKIVLPADSTTVLRRARYEYDFAHGKLTRQVLYNGTDSSVYDFQYEPTYGNLSAGIQPENYNGDRMTYHYIYDNTVHTYPVYVDNSYGEHATTSYNYCFGKPTCITDPTGSSMTYGYDFAGRLVSVTSPLNTSGTPSLANQYHPKNYYHNGFNPRGYADSSQTADRPYSVSMHYDDNGHLVTETAVLTNGFGQVIQTKEGLCAHGGDSMLVSGRTVKDAFGRTVRQYDPVTESRYSRRGGYNSSCDTSTLTMATFDALDRATSTHKPLGVNTQTTYSIGNDQGGHRRFVTATTDPNGNVTAQYADYEGRPVQITDALGGITLMQYDNLGQLISSSDPEGFATTYRYDTLGRMTKRVHPDAGETRYTYDNAGNLLEENNPLGQINFDYTYYRLLKKRYSYMTGNDVTYTYGTGGTSTGRPIHVVDGSGSSEYMYDALGNIKEETRTLALPHDNRAYRFTMKYTYDSWGRLKEMTYPDGEYVEYSYLWGGNLRNITGWKNGDTYSYVPYMEYNTMGQKEFVQYGNGTSVRYGYDALHRLDHLVCQDGSGVSVQDISYSFDPSGNIVGVTDNGVAANGLGGGYANSHVYDSLHRLVSSVGGGSLGTYTTAMHYTASGRLVNAVESVNSSPSDRWYGYCEDDRPHAPRMVWDEKRECAHDLRWDASGNLTQRTTYNEPSGDLSARFLFWTIDNRLHTVADENYYSYYVYDHQGNRAIKLTGRSDLVDVNAEMMSTASALTSPTLYPSPYLVLTEKGYTKHYYAGTERLAARLGCGGLNHLLEETGLNTTADLLFDQCLERASEDMTAPNEMDCINLPEPFEGELKPIEPDMIPLRLVAEVAVELKDFRETMDNVSAPCLWSQAPALEVGGAASWEDAEEVYFYHSDHLGSASWITDHHGDAIQHLQYLPFGEPFVDQHPAGYQERFTFTGKERDKETGYGYFGARYMDYSMMTSFISVDRYASKYPFISPYAYCAWNPIKLTDPNGDTIVIKGSLADDCVERLRSRHINLSRDPQTGVLSASLKEGYSEKDLFEHEALLYEAICGESSRTCHVEITAERTFKNTPGQDCFYFDGNIYATLLGGSAMGTKYDATTKSALSRSFVDPILIEQNGYDQGVAHEVIEAFILAFISTELKIDFEPAYQQVGKKGKDPLIRVACSMSVHERVGPAELHEFGPQSGMIEHLNQIDIFSLLMR